MRVAVDWTQHVALLTALTALLATHAPAGACVGDCNGTCSVEVNEVLTGVVLVLGSYDLDRCEAMDADRDGTVLVHEVIMAVRNALDGCSDPPPEILEPGGGTQVLAGTVTAQITVPLGAGVAFRFDGADVTDRFTIAGGVATGSLGDVPPGMHELIVLAYCGGSAQVQFEAIAP